MDYRRYQSSVADVSIHTNRGYDRQSYDNMSPYDSKNNSLQKKSNIKEPSSSFLKTTSAKVIVIIGAIAGVCLVVGGAAGLAYYLGTLGKISIYKLFVILY
jgi:hypothetical protein